jgi:hypothetical protein
MSTFKEILSEKLPSLDSLKYSPKDDEGLIDSLIKTAKAMGGEKGDVTANIAFAMKKKDTKKIKTLIKKFGDKIIGGQGTVNEIQKWIKDNS